MITIMSNIWASLFSDALERHLAEGDTLFRRGDAVHAMFLVRDGTIALRRALADGGSLELHHARTGRLVAEASLFADSYHCDAICETKLRIAVLPRAKVRMALQTGDRAIGALEQMAQEVQALRGRLEVMRLKTLRARLDAYLALHGPPQPGGWVGVADWIGVTPEALYRELARRHSTSRL